MQGIGKILKKTREEREITLEEVAEATKIRSKYLRALEEEQFDMLPGDVYARGFATAYLKYLGIRENPDVVEIMQPKQKELEETVEKTEEESKPTQKAIPNKHVRRKKRETAFEEVPLTKNAKLILLLSAVAILMLFAIQWIYTSQMAAENPPEDPVQQKETQQEKEPEVSQEPAIPSKPVEPTYNGLEMRLEILDTNPDKTDQCWMEITVDGKKTQLTLSEGQIQEIQANETIQLNLGNAGVVKVTLNGQDFGVMGNQGQVVKKEFQLEDFVTTVQ